VRKCFVLTAALIAACQFAAIAPATEPNDHVIRKTYPVADLVIPQGSTNVGKMAKPPATTEDRLIHQIVENVSPSSWTKHGGQGTIQYFAPTMSIVVDQDVVIQEQVADLLKRLRKEQDTQVAVEVRIVSMTEDAFSRLDETVKCSPMVLGSRKVGDTMERVGIDFEPKVIPVGQASAAPVASKQGKKFLSEVEMTRLLERAADDVHTNVCTAPKMTLLNGQRSVLSVPTEGVCKYLHGQEPADAFRLTVKPVVSADQRFVKLALKVEDKSVTEPIQKSVVVPDGGTVLLGGFQRASEKCEEVPVPVVSEIPYLNRLFKIEGTGQESRRVLVLVTSRIIVPEEEVVVVRPPAAEASGCQVRVAPRILATANEKPARQVNVLAELLQAYDAACVEGRGDEAEKLARAALILDPACFHRSK
jgi:general secretion pathway protein D